jgi:hypothetical protein
MAILADLLAQNRADRISFTRALKSTLKELVMERQLDTVDSSDHVYLVNMYFKLELKALVEALLQQHTSNGITLE